METLHILFYIKKTKTLKNGECPIFCRLTKDKERAEFGTKQSVNSEQWDAASGRVKGKSAKALKVNFHLTNIQNELEDIEKQSIRDHLNLSAKMIKNELIDVSQQSATLIQLYDKHNTEMEALVGKDYAPKTLARHKTSLKHLKAFLHERYKVNDFAMSRVDYNFLMNYEFYLKTRTSCQHNAVIKYIKNLGKILRIALNSGMIKQDPFLNTSFRYQEIDKPFLTSDELDAIRKKKFKIKRVEKVRDIFLFCCYTGLAFIDVKDLRKQDIITGVDGGKWIRKKRQKTKNWSSIPLLPSAQKLLKKYESDLECIKDGTLLPVPSNQKMNSYLKEISDLCGIEKTLTTHVARHTFATTVTLANKVSMESVSKMLGHSSLAMTKKYARIVDTLLAEDIKKVKVKY